MCQINLRNRKASKALASGLQRRGTSAPHHRPLFRNAGSSPRKHAMSGPNAALCAYRNCARGASGYACDLIGGYRCDVHLPRRDIALPVGWDWARVEAERLSWGIADNMVPVASAGGAVAWATIDSVGSLPPASPKGALRRQLSQYANCSPDAISGGSKAMIGFFVADAQHDIAVLSEALRNFTDGRDIAYTEALRIAREALQPKGQP